MVTKQGNKLVVFLTYLLILVQVWMHFQTFYQKCILILKTLVDINIQRLLPINYIFIYTKISSDIM